MEKQKISKFKIFIMVIFAILVFAAFFFKLFWNFSADFPLKENHVYYICVGLCFLLALIFIKFNLKNLLIVFALAGTVVADCFLVLNPVENNMLVGLSILCGVQFLFLIYTLLLNKSIGSKVVNIAVRVALVLCVWFILPTYVELDTYQLMSLIYLSNFLVSLGVFLVHIKTQWLLFLGFLLVFVSALISFFVNGGIALFGLSGLNFLLDFDYAFLFYIPGLFLIASASAWARESKD